MGARSASVPTAALFHVGIARHAIGALEGLCGPWGRFIDVVEFLTLLLYGVERLGRIKKLLIARLIAGDRRFILVVSSLPIVINLLL